MGWELHQRWKFRRRTLSLTLEGVRVSSDSWLSGKTEVVPYEVIYGKCTEIKSSTQEAFYLAVASFLGGIALAVGSFFNPEVPLFTAPLCALLAIPFFIYFQRSRGELIWYMDGHTSFWVVRDQPSVEAVERFLDEIRKRARERVRSRLLPLVHSKDEYADREHAFLLREKGIITEAECAEFVHGTAAKPHHDGDTN